MSQRQQLATWCQTTFGLTPVEVLMRIAVNPENDVRIRSSAAASAAPYVHQRLRQVELVDNTQKSKEQLEHDVHAILGRYVRAGAPGAVVATVPSGSRDLIG